MKNQLTKTKHYARSTICIILAMLMCLSVALIGMPKASAADSVTAFAVYCSNDNSLTFYTDDSAPSEGSTYNKKKVTTVYTGLNNTTYCYCYHKMTKTCSD